MSASVNSTSSISLQNAKIISGFTMLGSTFLGTMIPALILRKAAQIKFNTYNLSEKAIRSILWRHRVLSTIHCFAAGIFISAGMLHIFVDANADIAKGLLARSITTKFPLATFILLCGIFILLIIEQFVNYIVEQKKKKKQRKKFSNNLEISQGQSELNSRSTANLDSENGISVITSDEEMNHSPESGHSHDEMIDPHSPIQSIILVIALSFHSIFEGMSLGLQETTFGAFELLLVIMVHKLPIAVCMGINLAQTNARIWFVITIAAIFAVSSPIGAFMGVGITTSFDPLIVGVLDAFACGTFVYVTCFEIIPQELGKKNCSRSLCILGLMIGFIAFSLYTFFHEE